MTSEGILAVLTQGIEEIQTRSGQEIVELDRETRLAELDGFDSIQCVELELWLTERLGVVVEKVLIGCDEPAWEHTLSDVGEVLDTLVSTRATSGD